LRERAEREEQKQRENTSADFHTGSSLFLLALRFRAHREKNTITLWAGEASLKSRGTPKRAPGATTFVESLFLLH
jgi:hypothetical protein